MPDYNTALAEARRMGPGARVEPVSISFGQHEYRAVRPTDGGGGGGSGGMNLSNLYQQYQGMAEEAEKANKAREKEIRSIYSNILNSISGSNSSLRASGLADIERQAGQLVGQETQGMISSGLYGTTTTAAIPRNVATSFTQPSRIKLEDLLAGRKREAQLGLAGFVERIENPYPDYNSLMQAQIAAQ